MRRSSRRSDLLSPASSGRSRATSRPAFNRATSSTTTGQWVGERETRGADGEITRETEWFDTEPEARSFSRGKGAPAAERNKRALRELFADWLRAHGGFGSGRCSLTDNGVAARIAQYREDVAAADLRRKDLEKGSD